MKAMFVIGIITSWTKTGKQVLPVNLLTPLACSVKGQAHC